MDDEIKELVRDLRARAATCKALAVKDINPSTTRRLLGKAAAYTHSAELAQAMANRLGVKPAA